MMPPPARLTPLITELLIITLLAAGCADDEGGADPDLGAAADARPSTEKGVPPGDGQAAHEAGKPRDLGPDKPKGPTRWRAAGKTLQPAVAGHTATLLKDGRVLIAGGVVPGSSSYGQYVATAYLYDPKSDKFVSAGNMNTARSGHGAELLPDGRVLLVGGAEDRYKVVASADLFDPKQFTEQNPQKAWSKAAPMTTKRSGFGTVRLSSGKVLVVGGSTGGQPTLASLEIYDPTSGTWTVPAAGLSEQRAVPAVALLRTGKVLVAGGWHGDKQKYLDTIEIYDAATNTVKASGARLRAARTGATAVTLKDSAGQVLITGKSCNQCTVSGDDLYNPITDKVTAVTHPGGAAPYLAAVSRLADGRVLITGGYGTLDRGVVYGYASGGATWKTLPPMTNGRFLHTQTALASGSVLVVGGRNGAPLAAGPVVGKAEILENP